MDRKMSTSRESWHFCFHVLLTRLHFTICNLTWRVNKHVSHQRKCLIRKNESTKGLGFCTGDDKQSLFVFPTTLF